MTHEDINQFNLFYESIAVNEEESFDFESLSKFVVKSLIQNIPPFVYAICGNWGCGKSSLLKFVLEGLKTDEKNCIAIYFNAWRSSFHNDIFTVFIHELVDQLLKADKIDNVLFNRSNFKGILNSFKESAMKTALEPKKHILSSFFYNLYESASNHSLKEKIKSERKIQEKFNEISKILSDEKINIYVFIDEIDRCEPKSVVRIFEALRAFFCGEDILKREALAFNKSMTKPNHKIKKLKETTEPVPFKYIVTFDENYISKCFASVYGFSGNEAYSYISKYIQHKYHVPLKKWGKFVLNIFNKFGKIEEWLPKVESENEKLPLLYNTILSQLSDIYPRDVRLIVTYILFWLEGFAIDMKSYSLEKVINADRIWKENEKVCWEMTHAYLLIQAFVKVKYPSLAIFVVEKRILIDFLIKDQDIAKTIMDYAKSYFVEDFSILECKRLSNDLAHGISQIDEKFKALNEKIPVIIGFMLEKLCSV